MARKRKSSEMGPTSDMMPQPDSSMPEPNGSRPNGEDLTTHFQQFCRDAGLSTAQAFQAFQASHAGPRNTQHLESQHRRLRQLYNFCWWRAPARLQEEVTDFLSAHLASTATYDTEQAKLQSIIDRLEALRTATPVRGSNKKVHVASALPTLDEPPSPTPATRKSKTESPRPSGLRTARTINFRAAKEPVASQPLAHAPELHRSVVAGRVDPSTKTASAAPLTSYFGVSKQAVAGSSKPMAVDTSFATTATRSFAASSLSTQPTQASTQQTDWSSSSEEEYLTADSKSKDDAAPSDEDAHTRLPVPVSIRPTTRDSSDYLSSLSTNTAQQLRDMMMSFEPSQNSTSTVRTAVPRLFASVPAPSPSSPESDWGSLSIDSNTAHMLHETSNLVPHRPDSAMLDVALQTPSKLSKPTTLRLPIMRFTPSRVFAQLKIPEEFQSLPFSVQWEAQRLLQTNHVTAEDIAARWRPRNLRTLYDLSDHLKKPFRRGFDVDDYTNFDQVTMSASLQYATSSAGAIFDLVLQPPKKDKSCDLQRRYGADRVLYVDFPSFRKCPVQHKGRDIQARFQDMATRPQHFLGRRWILYVVQPNKKTKNSAVLGSNRAIFFAIDRNRVSDLFDYVIPYRENAHQAARKLYTRLELMISRTTPTVQLQPEDVDFKANDQLATRDPDNDQHLDPALKRDKAQVDPEYFDAKKEMSDGCAPMSPWTYWQIHRALGMENIRSAVQARIGGAKGVWYRGREDYTGMDDKPAGTHIELRKTQVKVNRETLNGCDPGTLTMNVVKFNSYAKTSILHPGFMPILLDRGVPRQIMLDVIRSQVQAEMHEFEEAVKGGAITLRRWIHTNNSMFEERNREVEIPLLASGLPASREERIILMLEAGFDPSTCPYLAREVELMAKQIFDMKRQNYKIKLNRSTTLMGIADPYGVLEPGQVHVNFSSPFVETSGMSWLRLHKMEGLVARNPALAPWDIQKVELVSHPELEHLPDLVIFPSRGRRPLAGLLQGGDYDGDTFWICWEPKLTRLFKNAPCPIAPPPEHKFHIKKRTEKLSHYVKDYTSDDEWCQWLGEMAVARMGFNLLGMVTKLHERLVYATGDIKSPEALTLVYLHDYLVDADKQGYDFNFDDLKKLKESLKLSPNLPEPAYWSITTKEESKEDEEDHILVTNPSVQVRDNIIDDAYFNVIQPAIDEALKRLSKTLNIGDIEDNDLTRFYDDMASSSTENSTIRTELEALKDGLQNIRKYWGSYYTSRQFDDLVNETRRRYDDIQPQNSSHPTIIEWLRRLGNDLTTWDKLKASALAKFHHRATRPGKMVFSVAGNELCRLKTRQSGWSRELCMEQYRMLKLRKLKKIEFFDEYGNDGGNRGDGDEDDAMLNEYY